MFKNSARFYLGTTIYDTEVPVVDINLPDPELFEAVLHDMAVKWSSTGGVPHHKQAMCQDGRVVRFQNSGHVYICGNGWTVSIYQSTYCEAMAAALEAKDTDTMGAMVIPDTAWKYEPPIKPERPKRWRK